MATKQRHSSPHFHASQCLLQKTRLQGSVVGALLPAQKVEECRYQRLWTPKLLLMLQQLQNKHHPLPAELPCFWCQFCILRLSKKARQTIRDLQGNATVLQETHSHSQVKKAIFLSHSNVCPLLLLSGEVAMCGLLTEAPTHFKQTTTKKFRLNLKKQVFLGNTSGSGEKKNLLPVTVQMMICLPSRKPAGTTSG